MLGLPVDVKGRLHNDDVVARIDDGLDRAEHALRCAYKDACSAETGAKGKKKTVVIFHQLANDGREQQNLYYVPTHAATSVSASMSRPMVRLYFLATA